MGALNPETLPLRGRTIGVYGSGGAPWHHLALAASYGADVRVVRAEDVAAGRLDALDVLVMPGGGAIAMAGLLNPLGEEGATTIRRWVEGGGTYVSSCAGSVLPLALTDEAAAALPIASCLRMVDAPLANPGDATLGGLASPGVGRIGVRLDRAHPIARGLPESIELVHYNGPLFDLSRAPETVRPFAWPTAATADFTPAERFLPVPGARTVADEETVLAGCIDAGAATALEASHGHGRAILFGSHPEFGLGPLALGWGDGAGLLASAFRYAADTSDASAHRRARRPVADRARGGTGAERSWSTRPERPDASVPELAREVVRELRRAAERFETLARTDAGGWLAPESAPSFHGRDARSAWCRDGRAAAAATAAAAEDLAGFADELGDADRPWLDDAAREDQDFGAMGLVQLVTRLHGRLDGADEALPRPPVRPAHAYDLFDSHPYHLAVGSYLSAAGLAAAALLTTLVLGSVGGRRAPASERVAWSGVDHTDGTTA